MTDYSPQHLSQRWRSQIRGLHRTSWLFIECCIQVTENKVEGCSVAGKGEQAMEIAVAFRILLSTLIQEFRETPEGGRLRLESVHDKPLHKYKYYVDSISSVKPILNSTANSLVAKIAIAWAKSY